MLNITSNYLKMFRFYKNKPFYVVLRLKHDWIEPEGYNTGIQVYNSTAGRKVPLKIQNPNALTWYTCGPTVYDASHIGHASCYVKLDIIQRILKNHFKFNVISVMNVTDIDDKIIQRSEILKIPIKDLTKRYEKEFWTDLNALGINKPDIILRVTDNMPLIINFIEKLINNGQAYIAENKSVYFDLSTFQYYGKLQNISDESGKKPVFKRNVNDFALWKATKEGEPFWDSPWGPGRPGWHIECSTLASHIFGNSIDIHAGGIDLRFPHHENEEAQSCAFHKTPQWVNYWLHVGHLHLKHEEKMSKSLKNTISIEELLKETNSDVFRMACIMSHYRNNLEYSKEFMNTAERYLNTYKHFISNCNDHFNTKYSLNVQVLNENLNETKLNIHNAFCDDFNTSSVLKSLNELISSTNSMLQTCPTVQNNEENSSYYILAVSKFVSDVLNIFGIDLVTQSSNLNNMEDFNEIINILINFRQEVRQTSICDKNKLLLNLCDNVREDLRKIGVNIKDIGKQSTWSR